MASVNKVILLGRLGQDPTVNQTQSGKSVCNFSLATDEQFKDAQGQVQKRTDWHKCVAWGKTGETVSKYLVKGSQVYVEGKLSPRKWQDKDGNQRTGVDVTVMQVVFVGSKQERPEQAEQPQDDQPSGW